MKPVRRYIYGVLIGLDQLGNALFGGYPDETISFRSANARDDGKRWGCVLCKVLDWIDPNHCDRSQRTKKASLLRRGLI
ncbi:hypothetical protein JQ617_08090 [Bradyrhizobium sp. KB893862 SZCCT0404]|nr:hypothetical protein [Bradyrhizobium sp. KB893862 SZCCT0404]